MEIDSQVGGRLTPKADEKLCDPCKKRGQSNVGLYYCFNCHELYCEACQIYHSSFKATADHRLAEVQALHGVHAEISHHEFLEGFMNCDKHPDREIDFYCEADDALLCLLCARDAGKSFADLEIISSLDLNEEQMNDGVSELKKRLESAKEHLISLQKLRKQSDKDFKLSLKQINDDIKQVRDQMIKLMDKVVQHVSDVTKQIELEIENRLDQDIDRVERIVKKPSQDFSLLNAVGQYGSERQKFVAEKRIKKQLGETEKHIADEDKCMKRFDAELQIANDLKTLIDKTDVSKLAQVKVSEQENIQTYQPPSTLDSTVKKLEMIGEYRTRPLGPEDCSPTYSGISVHMDGRLILSDSCNFQSNQACGFVCLYDPTCDDSTMRLKLNKPFSAVSVDGTHIAVSIPRDKTICIVSTEKELKVEKSVHTEREPMNIAALVDGQLAIAWNNPPAFGVVSISGHEIIQQTYFTQDASGRHFRSFEYLAVDEKRSHVIQPCTNDKAVYCFDLVGKPVFKYTDDELTSPRGVALDKFGNVFVCEYEKESIHMLSPGGKKIAVFQENIPHQPLAICTDRSSGTIFVTDYTQFDKITRYRIVQQKQ